MLTSIQINSKLLNEAKQLGKHQTEWETVNNALREYIQKHKCFLAESSDYYLKYDDMEKRIESPEELLKELRNSVTEYNEPTDPVGVDDWEALK